jgi:hypothetical protein
MLQIGCNISFLVTKAFEIFLLKCFSHRLGLKPKGKKIVDSDNVSNHEKNLQESQVHHQATSQMPQHLRCLGKQHH